MNVKEIVTKHLKDIGADGLCSDEGCGCCVDELIPCWASDIKECAHCVAAKKVKATEPGDCYDVGDEIFIPIEEVE
jgi:hypothetical protein